MNVFHERIKELRLEKGLSQGDVALKLEVTRSAYSNYEQGIREPSYDILAKLCLLFEVSADYLIGLTDNCW